MVVQLQMPIVNINDRIRELKLKYEAGVKQSFDRQSSKVKSPKLVCRTKVRQITHLFNSKSAQMVESNMINFDKFNSDRHLSHKSTIPTPIPKLTFNEVNMLRNNYPMAEDVFSKLSVKDKVLLYTKFIEDFSKSKYPLTKAGTYVYGLHKNSLGNGEVINEKQAPVKDLLDDLEAKFQREEGIPKSTSTPLTDLKVIHEISKAKVDEDTVKEVLHKSTLSMKVSINEKASTVSPKDAQEARFLPQPFSLNATLTSEQLFNSSAIYKRNNRAIQSVLPIEVYAPPRKIRRTRDERLARPFFPNQQLELLFYKWLKELSNPTSSQAIKDKSSIIENNTNNEKNQTSAVNEIGTESTNGLKVAEDKLIKTIHSNKKSNCEIKENILTQDSAINALPIPAPRRKTSVSEIPASIPSCSSTSSKHSEGEECESGVSTFPKITSDESQPETLPTTVTTTTTIFDEAFDPFMKLMKPLRKKKFRRMLAWKKDVPVIETQPLVTSTDSETDAKKAAELKKLVMRSNYIKRLFKKNIVAIPNSSSANTTNEKKLERTSESNNCSKYAYGAKSPHKIKSSSYTFTSMTSPSTNGSASDGIDVKAINDLKRETSYSWPTLITNVKNKAINRVKLISDKWTKSSELTRVFSDSFVDQGFETGSNEVYDSPKRNTLKQQATTREADKTLTNSKVLTEKMPINRTFSSTPIKHHRQQFFMNNNMQSGVISPIGVPLKNRRRSIYDTDSRRSSQIMEVIKEDQPFVLHDAASPPKRLSMITKPMTKSQFANLMASSSGITMTAMNVTENETADGNEKASKFWITSAGVTVALDVYYIVPERIRLLYEIFLQKIPKNEDVEFGIDDHKFSIDENWDENINSKRAITPKGCSHYWFSCGDLALPFSGRYLNAIKIRRVFHLISRTVKETDNLHFGIDSVEFSYASSLWINNPKLSFESSYSQLVGLSTRASRLDSRSKQNCPQCKPVCVTDLDEASDSPNMQETEFQRLSFSPFGSNRFDLSNLGADDLMMPRNSDAIMSPDLFQLIFDNEPLDKIFGDKRIRNSTFVKKDDGASIIRMQKTIKKTQKRLEKLQERLTAYCNLGNFSGKFTGNITATPENYKKLKEIVEIFHSIDQNNGIKHLSKGELENYMYILSRYANICLNSCINHMDKILDTLRCNQVINV